MLYIDEQGESPLSKWKMTFFAEFSGVRAKKKGHQFGKSHPPPKKSSEKFLGTWAEKNSTIFNILGVPLTSKWCSGFATGVLDRVVKNKARSSNK